MVTRLFNFCYFEHTYKGYREPQNSSYCDCIGLLTIIQIKIKNHHYAEALLCCNDALAFPTLDLNLQAECYCIRAALFQASGEYQKALEDCQKAIDLLFNEKWEKKLRVSAELCAQVWCLKAVLYWLQGKEQEAMGACTLALSFHPSSQQILREIELTQGFCHYKKGEYPEAQIKFKKALENADNDVELKVIAFYHLSLCALKHQREELSLSIDWARSLCPLDDASCQWILRFLSPLPPGCMPIRSQIKHLSPSQHIRQLFNNVIEAALISR